MSKKDNAKNNAKDSALPNPFPWRADQNDEFSWENGDPDIVNISAESQYSPPGHCFDKNNGCKFTMDGYRCTLSLNPGDADSVTLWGGSNVKNGAAIIDILDGTLKYDGTGIKQSCQFRVEYATVSLLNNGALEILGKTVDVTFSGDVLDNSDTQIYAGYQSQFLVDSRSFALQANPLNEKLISTIEMSAVMQITIRQGVMIDHVDMMVRDNATLAIQPAAGSSNLSLTLKNDATITVQDSAKAVFQMAPIIPASVLVPNNDQGSYFVIGKGSGGGFLFQVSNGVKPFDGTKKYPAGLFDFKSDADGDNQNKLVIYGIGNAFEFHNMLADKVLAINGTATNNVNLFNIKYAGDHTTVTLLAASADNA